MTKPAVLSRTCALCGALCVMLCMGLAACTPAVTYTYTDEFFRLSEPYGNDWVVNGTLCKTEVGGRAYLFEPTVTEEDRSAFIASEERLCADLDERGITTDGLRFIVLSDYANRADSAGMTAYFGCDTRHTYEQIMTTLQAALGDYTNYGYVYALANDLAGELAWAVDERPAADTDAPFRETPALLNLVYPCFTEAYAEEAEIAACRYLARACLADMTDPYGGEAAFLAAVYHRAREMGISFTPMSTAIGFAYGGVECPVKVRTACVEVFCSETYEKSLPRLDASVDPMARYDCMIAFFEDFDTRAIALRERFDVTADYLIPVALTDDILNEYSGLFKPGDASSIDLRSLYSLLHEYIHYLDFTRFIADGNKADDWSYWTHEVLTTYYSLHYDVVYRQLYAAAGVTTNPSVIIGSPYENEADELVFRRIMLATTPERSELLYRLKTAYGYGAASFGGYFAELYGDAALIECMIYPERTVERTGLTLDEIVDNWCAWVVEVADE